MKKKLSKRILLLCCSFSILLLVIAVNFFFNPMGLGPEPPIVLSNRFFSEPSDQADTLSLLVGGDEAFGRILPAIDSAKESIYVQTYIWKDDKIGKQVVAGLKAAAARGVKVTVKKDILGTVFELGDLFTGRPSPVFTKAGLRGHENIDVDLEVFADTDHSKYFIVDGKLAIFGGMNIADEYHTQWHDYMVAIDSKQWVAAFSEKVIRGGSWPEPSPFMIAVNSPAITEIRTALIQMIETAQESIIIEHAYFSDDKVIAAVINAAKKGVKVDIILPEKADTHQFANMVTVNRLLKSPSKANIRVFLYPQMSHAKVVLTDGKIAAIGSANLTPRSMLTSREVTFFVHARPGDSFMDELHKRLVKDMTNSKQVDTPFALGVADNTKAFFGKYVW